MKRGIFMPKGKPNKRYMPEFKIKAAETMQKEGLSYRETTRLFEIKAHDAAAKRERICLEEGKEGFYAERRGRKSTDFNSNKNELIKLYLLLIYGFNRMLRFNRNGDFNLPVGNVDFNNNVVNALILRQEKSRNLSMKILYIQV